MTETAARHAPLRPVLDEISRHAMQHRPRLLSAGRPDSQPGAPAAEPGQDDAEDAGSVPDALLWAALCQAPGEGIAVADLIAATGMSQRWVFDRLRTLARVGRAHRIRRGFWRATRPESDAQ